MTIEDTPCEILINRSWVPAVILFSSHNSNSIAVESDEVDRRRSTIMLGATGKAAFLLSWDELRQKWVDVGSGLDYEIRLADGNILKGSSPGEPPRRGADE